MKFCLALAVAAPFVFGLRAQAQASFEVVGTFPQTLGLPEHGLVSLSDGSLYGLARFGGAGDSGALFKADATNNVVVKIASFSSIGGEIGAERLGLAVDSADKIFGVTPFGGTTGDGTLWCWSSTGGLVKLASFTGATTGEKPHGNVVWDGTSTLYGICESGGQYNNGTLWKWTSAGGVVRLYSFQNYGDALSLGGRPQSIALNGTTLYGITLERDPGGADIPVLWSRSSTGTMKQAAVFDSDVAGFPLGQILPCDTGVVGVSYANQATRDGVNRLWRFSGSKTPAIVKTFPAVDQDVCIGTADGGTIFGTSGNGKIWSWSPTQTFTSEGTLPASDGEPGGQLVVTAGGDLFGTALNGTDGAGTVWHWSATGDDVVATFDGLPMGGDPNGLWIDDRGSVFGVETIKQLIWRWSPATGSTPEQLADVESPTIGFVTFGNVVGDGQGNLFGFTKLGVAGNAGVLWCWNGIKGLTKLGSFGTSAVPGNTTGAIACDQNGNVFGTTEQLVSGKMRTHLWRWNGTDGLDRIATLALADGGAPTHTLVVSPDGSAVYGTTTTGGDNDKGTLWAWTAADGVLKLADFGTPATIGKPGDGLVVSTLGAVFGVSTSGGTNGDGLIWKWVPVTGLTIVKSFDSATTGSLLDTDGSGLILASDGVLYGTAENGGANGIGTFWSCNVGAATPALTALKHFDPAQLSHPSAQRLMQGPDGMIYGLALHGIWRYGTPPSTPPPPSAVTLAPSYLSATRVVIEGSANANGTSTDLTFEYGTDPLDLSDMANATPDKATGGNATSCSLELSGLEPKTTYYYRLKAANANGTTIGDVMSFTTMAIISPVAVTKPASGVGVNDATLNGMVTLREDISTDTWFELGTSAAQLTTIVHASAVSGTAPTTISANASNLLAHTRYYVRAKASNDNGQSTGATLSFTTLNTAPVAADDTFEALPSSSFTLDVLGNDSDADSDKLSVLSFTQPAAAAGRVTRVGNALVFTAAATFANASFRYTISDGFGGTATGNVSVTRGSASLDIASQTLSSAGGSYPVQITTTLPWNTVVGASWMSASPKSGTGDGTITVSATPNASKTARIGTIVIGGIAHTLTQSGVTSPTLVAPATIPEGIISGPYQLTLTATGFPLSFSASNLPPGLRITATGNIEGTPTRAGTFTVVAKATNAAGSASATFDLKVNALPPYVVGAFSALFQRHDLNAQLGGLLTFTTTAAGSMSGTLKFGAASYPFVDHVDACLVASGPCLAAVDIPRKGLTPLHLVITFGSDSVNPGITATVESAAVPGTASATGAPHPFSGTSASAFAGAYNSVLDLTSGVSDSAIPQGTGFTVHKVLGSGATTWSGKLSDGTAISGSSALWADGGVPMWQLLYTGPSGSVSGTARISAPSGMVAGQLDWLRKPQAATERKYAAGFGPLSLDVKGSKYVAPAAGSIVLGLPDQANNARLRFFEGALANAEQAAAVNQIFRITTANLPQLALPGSADNLTGVKLTLSATTGSFLGSFALRDSNVITPSKPYLRNVSFEGLLVPGQNLGAGYFLLNGLPSDTNWKTLSGKVVLDAKP